MTTSGSRRLRSINRAAGSNRASYWLAGGLGLAGAAAFVAAAVLAAPDAVEGAGSLPPTAPAATQAAGEDTTATAVEEPIALPMVSYELFLARDPFEPVVPEPEPEPDPADPTDPADPADPTDPTAPSDPVAPSDPSAPGDGVVTGTCTGDTEVVCDGRVISVVEVFESNGAFVAVIQVDTMRYEVRAGDTIADVFEVVSISADEVRLLYGDRVVRVKVGDNALK